jgi:hypothetical protein
LSTASTVYVLPNALEKHCIEAEPFLDKSGRPGKNAAFAHVMLWICRRFSTDAVISRAFCHPSIRRPGSEPDFWQCRLSMHRACVQQAPSASLRADRRRRSLRDRGIQFFLQTNSVLCLALTLPSAVSSEAIFFRLVGCACAVGSGFVHAKSRHCFK